MFKKILAASHGEITRTATRLTVTTAALAIASLPGVATACAPPRMDRIAADADLIVRGSTVFSRARGGARLQPAAFIKGRQAGPIRIAVDYPAVSAPARPACPIYAPIGEQSGTFYLMRQRDGSFIVLAFQR